ncbi:MAG: hypothetical protein KGJ13_09420, partial [Patescibacteria group bacterium]|nr:hypothetical protein [Patescibacteria group bacterium]
MTVSTMTAGVFIGSGTYLTDLNSDQLIRGTISSTVVSGAYGGITGVGNISFGSWQGSPVGTQYGGTGQNFIDVSSGSLVYFSGNGIMNTLLPGNPGLSILQSNGSDGPVWVSSPQISGANLYNVPLAAIQPGQLPDGIVISSGNIVGVSGSVVVGNISGLSGGINGLLPLSQLSTGTLSGQIVASSITVTGVSPGTFGNPSNGQGLQLNVGTDGRLYSISQASMTIPAANISAGTLGSGVNLPASQVAAGTLGSGVIASSVAANGVIGGAYGSASVTPGFTVDNSGRITKVSTSAISIPASSINTAIPITSIATGTFAANQTASSITVTGVSPGVYGDSQDVSQITIGTDGRISSARNVQITGAAPTGAAGGVLSGNYPNPSLAGTGVTAANYGNVVSGVVYMPSISVNSGGQVTSASQILLPNVSTSAALVNVNNAWTVPQTFPEITASTGIFSEITASTGIFSDGLISYGNVGV